MATLRKPRKPHNVYGTSKPSTYKKPKIPGHQGVPGGGFNQPFATPQDTAAFPGGVGYADPITASSAPPPAAPAPPAPPPPTGIPRTPASAVNVANAASQMGISTNDVNRQLLEAAYRFGGVKNTDQYIFNPETGSYNIATQNVQGNENSQLAQIQRALDQGDLSSKNARLRGGTLRSGLRLQDLTDVNNEAERNRARALDEYQSAVATIRGLLEQAFGDYRGAVSSADAADLTSYLAQPPQDPGDITPTTPEEAAGIPIAIGGQQQPSGTGHRVAHTVKKAPKKRPVKGKRSNG